MLKNKVAVISGAAGAIGGAVARTFAREGAKLFLTGRLRGPVAELAKEVVSAGGVAEVAEVDALEARVDLVSRWQRHGSAKAGYYTRYAEVAPAEDLRAEVGVADGVPVLAIYRSGSPQPAYFVRLRWEQGHLTQIWDFYFVPYLAAEARFTKA